MFSNQGLPGSGDNNTTWSDGFPQAKGKCLRCWHPLLWIVRQRGMERQASRTEEWGMWGLWLSGSQQGEGGLQSNLVISNLVNSKTLVLCLFWSQAYSPNVTIIFASSVIFRPHSFELFFSFPVRLQNSHNHCHINLNSHNLSYCQCCIIFHVYHKHTKYISPSLLLSCQCNSTATSTGTVIDD